MLSWMSLGSPLEVIGAPRNIQGAVDSYVYGDRAPGLLKLLIIGCGNQAVNIDSGVCSGGQGHHQGATDTTQWCGSMKTRPASWTSSPCLCKNGSIMEKSIQVAASHCSLIYTSFTQSLRPLCLHRKTIKLARASLEAERRQYGCLCRSKVVHRVFNNRHGCHGRH